MFCPPLKGQKASMREKFHREIRYAIVEPPCRSSFFQPPWKIDSVSAGSKSFFSINLTKMPFNNAAAVSARPLSLHTGMQKYLKGGKNLDKYWLAEKTQKT